MTFLQGKYFAWLCFSLLLTLPQVLSSKKVKVPWNGQSVRDLHREYNNIFRYGNRNAASHLWSSFLLDRSESMSKKKLEYMFSGFCAVSGSPVNPSQYNRYGLTLNTVDNRKRFGFLHYCCWPCVCDTQDFIEIDTLNVTTKDGMTEPYYFAVIGNPCENKEKLKEPFYQPFDGRQTTLEWEARELRCDENGRLIGATLSDHGFVIISMFFDSVSVNENTDGQGIGEYALSNDKFNQPGRMTKFHNGLYYQSENEYESMCSERKRNGYNSGMGEIFRKVAAITPIIRLVDDGSSRTQHKPTPSGAEDAMRKVSL